MADDTTTSTAVDDQAPVEEQLDTTDTSEAVETDESSTSETEEPSKEDNSDDFNDWAAKKNLPLDDPEKLGRMYRELETKLGSDDRKNQLSKSVETANTEAGVDDVQGLKNQVAAGQNPGRKTMDGERFDWSLRHGKRTFCHYRRTTPSR